MRDCFGEGSDTFAKDGELESLRGLTRRVGGLIGARLELQSLLHARGDLRGLGSATRWLEFLDRVLGDRCLDRCGAGVLHG